MLNKCLLQILLLASLAWLVGCSGIQSFPSTVRAGDTAVVAAGWKQNFSRDNITVTITPASGAPVVLFTGHPAVRAVINMYPDPLSSLIVSEETDQEITPFAQSYGVAVNFFTGGDKDMWQTTVYIDLPASLPPGLATIDISNTQGDSTSSTVNIIAGTGQPELFEAELNGPLLPMHMEALERIQHYVVSFTGPVVPHAIQVNFNHAADSANGGAGKAYVSNPRGDIKSVLWSDNGFNLNVLLTPTQSQTLLDMQYFKFYVSGGINGLQVNNVVAVDINGNNILGVVADVVSAK